ncbi:response regulator transcription factor [Paenibacillus koleovorans]|uniref:response regulator transcription factor n=1 Tax=Paenibacillus koleovorans TaxID=121608 RepID=UPI000FD8D7AE|nr:response regulator [Paenibacillus koleovorans]
MAYKLIIVDDEEHIREGLSDLVDWTSLGFELVAKLEDGIYAKALLEKTKIDIILTDVKMTHMSGLELAKHVHEHHPKTKIVLISGFKEFEFVKQAMAYNVVNYLLKPTKLSDIRSVFQDVKARLDKEAEEQQQMSKVMKHNNELLPLIRKQLFRDLSTGKLNDAQEAEKLLRLTEVRANTADHRCAVVRLAFLPSETEEQETEEAFASDSIENMIRSEAADRLIIPVFISPDHMDIVALDLQPGQDTASFRSSVLSSMQTAAERIYTLLGIEAKPEIVGTFDNLRQLMHTSTTYAVKDENQLQYDPTEISFKENPLLAEQRKQFLSYINVGNMEALPGQFEMLLSTIKLGSLPNHFVKNMLIELFSTLCAKLNEMDLPIDKITNKPFYYETILRLNSYAELQQWGIGVLSEIADYIVNHTAAEPTMIQKAKEYIAQSFDKDISLDSAASQVYLSPDYFGRLFKQYTGSSFTDFVTEYRMNKALEYLQNPQFKIYEIGSIVGYKNTKYFFKLFKKHTGYTPSEYRRKSINKEK